MELLEINSEFLAYIFFNYYCRRRHFREVREKIHRDKRKKERRQDLDKKIDEKIRSGLSEKEESNS